MKRNIGSTDKIIRICIFLSLIILILTGELYHTQAWIGGAIGGLLLISSIAGFSFIYFLLGFDTYNVTKKKKLVR